MTTIPTFQELNTAIIADLQAQYGVSISSTGKVFLRVLAAVQAARLKLLYLVLANVQKNIAPDTADSESIGGTLERFGRLKLGRNPFAAQAAQYLVEVNGSIGAVINSQVTFKSDDDSLSPGIIYILDNPFTLSMTTHYITVRALTAGLEGKLNIADTLTVTSPIALVNSSVSVASNVIQPLSAETIEEYRIKVIASYQKEPQGGAVTDYILWSQDAQGVAQVYPYAKSGVSNQVDLYVESNIADSTDGKGTPSSSMLLDVESVVNNEPDLTIPILERGRKPITVIVNYLPVAIINVDIEIPSFTGLTADIQTGIFNALKSAISQIRPFVPGYNSVSTKNDVLDINKIIGIIITQQPGASFSAPVMKINGVPLVTYQFAFGNIPYLNSVTYP
jgi:hypothetical protein